jgi:hypothetical protein
MTKMGKEVRQRCLGTAQVVASDCFAGARQLSRRPRAGLSPREWGKVTTNYNLFSKL